jgi:nitric oxide reductase large subunit
LLQFSSGKWTFYFLIAVGFWNFVGAGILGFLINLPIVSYFEVGTMTAEGKACIRENTMRDLT